MSAGPRWGFSLVELLVSMTLLGIVTGSVASLALSAVRTADRSRERARQEAVLREVAAVVERELGDVSPARDIAGFAAESVTYRGTRGSGFTCGIDGGAVVIRDADYRAWRLPDPARDSLLVLVPEDSIAGPERWAITPLFTAPARGRCRDGAPGIRLMVDAGVTGAAALADLPLRVFEWMRIRLYESGGAWWVGARSLRPGDATQPIAGPFMLRGLAIRLLDGAAHDVVPADATLLEITLVPASPVAGAARRFVSDTLTTTFRLSNGGLP